MSILPFKIKRDYPYMYARISAKRAKLYDAQEYENMLKMEPNGIAKKLEEGEYKKEIDELAQNYEGVELVELALNRNLSNTMQHLTEIAPPELKEVMTIYLRKFDLLSLKRLLRWKKGGEKGEIRHLIVPASKLGLEEFEELSEQEFEEIVGSINFPNSDVDYQTYLEETESLPEIESALDNGYYEELEKLANRVNSPQFKKFVREELEHEAVMTALRLKKYGIDDESIRENLIENTKSDLVEEIIAAGNIDEAIASVNNTQILEREETELEEIENALETERLQRALRMLHTEPLGITSVLGYLIAKIVEVRNLRMLIRAKEAKIQEIETIRSNLVLQKR